MDRNRPDLQGATADMSGPIQAPVIGGGGAPQYRAAPVAAGTLAPVIPLAFVIYLFLLFPVETRPIDVGISLPLYRLALLALIPWMINRLARGHTRLILPDWLILLAAGWTLIGFALTYGLEEGIVRGMGVVIDFAGSYTLARLAIDSPQAMRRLLVLIAPGLFLVGLEMMIESLGGRLIVRPFFAGIFGEVPDFQGGEVVGKLNLAQEGRLGLFRAYGPFSHPILGGILLTCLMPMWLVGGIRSWPRWLGIASAVMGIFSLSSAAFIGLVLGAGMVVADRLKRHIAGLTWPMIGGVVAIAVIAVNLVTNRGVTGLLADASLNPQTAYYRLVIWEYGSKVVWDNPLFGIGYNQWARPAWMTTSVDAHFLALAMRSGLPTLLLLILGMITAFVGTGTRAVLSRPADRDLLFALNVTLVVLVFGALSVTYFGEANVFFMMMIGIAASAAAGLRLDQSGRPMLDPAVGGPPASHTAQ
jgi:hypothetical protein